VRFGIDWLRGMKIRTLLGELIVSPKAVNAHRGESAGGRCATARWPNAI
jgi:hypothetical protein